MNKICKCKCGNDNMTYITGRVIDHTYYETLRDICYCKKCGRLYDGECFREHDLLPKPEMIEVPIKDWCKCSGWANGIIEGYLSNNDMVYCPFCGKKLYKEKEKGVEKPNFASGNGLSD